LRVTITAATTAILVVVSSRISDSGRTLNFIIEEGGGGENGNSGWLYWLIE